MITIGFCTREHNQKHIDHLKKTAGHPKVEVIEIINKGERSLTECYNEILNKAKFDIITYTHDDILLETKQWAKKLSKLYENNVEYGILGIAGTKYLPESGKWWEDASKMYGRVAHTDKGKTWLSSYSDDLGLNIEEVVVVDGVFFSVMKSRIKETFSKEVKGFHFYEIDFCFKNYLKGVKLGVTTKIRVNHMSIGATNDEWEKNRKIFAKKYKDDLPMNIKRVFNGDERFKILIGSETIKESLKLAENLVELKHNVTITTKFDYGDYQGLRRKNIKFFPLNEPLGYKMGDGKWGLNTTNGQVVSEEGKMYKISGVDFDIIHVSNYEIKEYLNRLYPELPCPNNLVNGMPIDDIIEEYQIVLSGDIDQKSDQKSEKNVIKIVSGWSNKGGSTFMFIRLTNALNDIGYKTIFYGPHEWHLDKCNSGLIKDFHPNKDDIIIGHFIDLSKIKAKKIILACHEKDLYEVGDKVKWWDEVVFLNDKHRKYHSRYTGPFSIIPNLKESFIKEEKEVKKIAGIIGSFDPNKQIEVSINRALSDGMKKVILFGSKNDQNYYNNFIKPLLSDKVIEYGFSDDKQGMYDMISDVYSSSKSEVASLVKDECETTGTKFHGNEATEHDGLSISNDEIIKKWIKVLELKDKKPIIHAYFISYNEEYVLPHVLKYYSKFCEKIIFIDNMSTDSSRDIINSFDNTEIIDYDSGGKFDDSKHKDIKNDVWKRSVGIADYVIVGDTDEFLYHENMNQFLIDSFKYGITFFKPHGAHMIADEELDLKPDDNILELIKYGFPVDVLNKPMMFDCNKITEINYSLGGHFANPIGEVKVYDKTDLKMLHYKYIGLKNHLKKCKPKGERLSDFNLKHGCGTYYLMSDDENTSDYRHYLNLRVKIID